MTNAEERARIVAMTAEDHIAEAARYFVDGEFRRAEIHVSLAAVKAALNRRQ